MKKRRIIIIAAIVLLLLVLFVPYRVDTLEDGGSKVYTAVMYKYIRWKGFYIMEEDGTLTESKQVHTSIHWYPDNKKSLDELRKEAFADWP